MKIDIAFHRLYMDEWLEDPFVKEMILDVEQSEVISPYCIQSPVLGQNVHVGWVLQFLQPPFFYYIGNFFFINLVVTISNSSENARGEYGRGTADF